MIVTALFFYVFAGVCIASAVMVIASRNPVHSVLFLILTFFNASGLFLLMGAEFLYQDALYPEAEYAFKHPLTREVAYRSQLAERRARVHGAVARAIEELESGQLDERAALLAHHWEQAGDAREAAKWHRRAAEWVGANDPAEALRHWRKVHALVRTMPESTETIGLAVTACMQALNFGWRLGAAEDNHADRDTFSDQGGAEDCPVAVAPCDLDSLWKLVPLGLHVSDVDSSRLQHGSSRGRPPDQRDRELADRPGRDPSVLGRED